MISEYQHGSSQTSQDGRRPRRTVQVGGGAPVVVQSMTMTDTADAASTARQCIELAEAGSEMVRVTVNLPEAAAAVPEIKQRMLDAGRHGAAHRRLPLQRPPAAHPLSRVRRGARQVPHQPRQRRHRPTARRAVRHHLRGRARQRQAGAHRRQRRLAEPGARRREDAGEHRPRSGTDLGGNHQRVHGAVGAAVDGARARVRTAQGSDHHLVQDVASARSHRRLSRSRAARPINRCTSA